MKRRHRSGNGREFEKLVLGASADWSNGFPSFMGFEEAIELALFKQPNGWNPLHPTTIMGAKLLEVVRFELQNLFPHDQMFGQVVSSATGLYTSVGTAADYWHSTDAIICCDLGHDAAPFVTVDLKARPDDGDLIREDHVVITNRHFSEIASNKKFRLVNISGVVADIIFAKLVQMGKASE